MFEKDDRQKKTVTAIVPKEVVDELKIKKINISKLIASLLSDYVEKKIIKNKATKNSVEVDLSIGAIPEFSMNQGLVKILETVSKKIQYEWIDLYGQELVLKEGHKAYVWTLSNPHKAKKNKASFLSRWFAKAHMEQIKKKEFKTVSEMKQEKIMSYTFDL